MHPARFLVLLLIGCLTGPDRASAQSGHEEPKESRISYGKQGLQFDDGTGNNFLWFGVRLQTRWGSNSVSDDEIAGAPVSESTDIKLNRGRLKLGGHLVSPAFTVYSEYDFVDSRLLDLRATYTFADWLSIRAGQWKSEFNRERIDSSGKQQFVERSVVTPWFTIDRQQAIMASGRIGKGSRGDTSYWIGTLSGAGRGGDTSEADGLWLARAQWNFSGRLLGFSQSALKRPREPLGSVAIAAVTGRSGFTAFSSAGGGQLPGLVNGEPDQYRLEQWMVETAYQHGGFSWQQEFHWKQVEDTLTGQKTRLVGGYVQAGMFLSEVFKSFPEPLELALRVARVDPNRELSGAIEKEFTLASNWFFSGHRNKLSLDISRVIRREAPETSTSNRVRLQWDWSF
ncbi:MAG: OprO/OprP family phosphate-selective porin [Gammaproteobacteria bacterium]|nr:OprO/OprP family phosphate-selective porin [Gammaproteobacteria bacterium]